MTVLSIQGVFSMPRPLHLFALILVVIGAVNWGLVGVAQFDLVAALFGGSSALMSRVVYSLVGLAGLTLIFTSLATERRRLPMQTASARAR
jgi:uncharacterized membrane protein YuzA (DUF378 family)